MRCPYVQTNVRWPLPVDQRLNELVTLLGKGGVQVTRSQLVAALVAGAPAAEAELQELFATYSSRIGRLGRATKARQHRPCQASTWSTSKQLAHKEDHLRRQQSPRQPLGRPDL